MERLLARANVIVLPQVFHLEVVQLAHHQQAHVGHDRTEASILQKFDWPGLHKDVARYINSCHVCQTSKFPKKRMKFPLKPLESGGPNELLQVDYLKLSTTEEGYQGVLMMVDHFSKYAVAKPYWIFDAKETCRLIMDHWISEYGAPIAIRSDNGTQFTAALTSEFLETPEIVQVHSSPYHPQTNGLVERQNRMLINLLKAVCSRRHDDWVELLPTVMGAFNAALKARIPSLHASLRRRSM